MKIALVNNRFNTPTGVSLSALDVLLALNRVSSQLSVFTCFPSNIPRRHDGFPLENIQINRMKRHKHLEKRPDQSLLRTMGSVLNSRIQDLWACPYSRLNAFDVVFVNGITSHRAGFFPDQGPTSVLILRESPDYLLNNPRTREKFDDLVMEISRYAFYIFVSQEVGRQWKKYLSIPPGHGTCIYNCSSEETHKKIRQHSRDHIREKLGFHKGDFVAVSVGTVNQRKGHDIPMALIPRILEVIPEFKYLIVGGTSSSGWTQQLKRQCRKDPRLENTVIFTGAQPNAMEYIYGADLLLHPARSEAQGRVLLEAMLLGTPIIAAEVGGIPEAVSHNEDGFLFSHDRPQELIKYLTRLHRDGECRQALTQTARQKYWSIFSRQHHLTRFQRFLEEIQPQS